MLDLLTDLSSQAKALPPQEQARQAEDSLVTLDPHEPDVDAAWDQELRCRIDAVERGAVQLVASDQAFATARARLGSEAAGRSSQGFGRAAGTSY